MSATVRKCPRCQGILNLPKPYPPRYPCPNCGAVLKLDAAAPPVQAVAPVPAAIPVPIKQAHPVPILAVSAVPPASLPRPTPYATPVHATPGVMTTAQPSFFQQYMWWLVGGGAGLLVLIVIIVIASSGRRPGTEGPPDDSDIIIVDNTKGSSTVLLTPRQKKINEAVQRGLDYLKKRLQEPETMYFGFMNSQGGAHTGAVALGGLTLVECGVSPDDPVIQQAERHVRNQAPNLKFTYSVSLSILFLERLHVARTELKLVQTPVADQIRQLALRLVAGQNRRGAWDYQCPVLTVPQEKELLDDLQANRFTPGRFAPDRYHDHSIGQFATLALWTARKQGVPVGVSLRTSAEQFRASRRGDGAWTYRDVVDFFRDTGTCAALIAFALETGIDNDQAPGTAPAPGGKKVGDKKHDAMIQQALRHLGQRVGSKWDLPDAAKDQRKQHTIAMQDAMKALDGPIMEGDPDWNRRLQNLIDLDHHERERGTLFNAESWGDIYFLWSLERVAVIYDLDRIEGKDWHEWGSDILLEVQQSDGSWQDRFPGLPDTCFALLFLKRANVVKDLTDKLRALRGEASARPGGGPPGVPAPTPPGKE